MSWHVYFGYPTKPGLRWTAPAAWPPGQAACGRSAREVVFGRSAGVTDLIPRDDFGNEIAVIGVKVTLYQPLVYLIDISIAD